MSGKSFSRSLSRALSWRRDGIGGGGGGGTGEGDGSRRLPWSEWLLASGLYVCVLGAGCDMVVWDRPWSSASHGRETSVSKDSRQREKKKARNWNNQVIAHHCL